jgi:hypothetical protein
VEFEVLTTVAMDVAIFWDIAPCSPCVDVSEELITFIIRVENHQLAAGG